MSAAILVQTQLDNIINFLEQNMATAFLMRRLQSHHESTYWHSLRVAYLTLMLARTYSMSVTEHDILFRSTLLHDIGKLTIPVEVLDKDEKLSSEEWALIQAHPQTGAELVEYTASKKEIDFDVILYHHQNVDGSGYPFGTVETELPLSVRIVRVVDSFDAMTSVRAYNKPMSVAEAVRELYEHGGTCFDLGVVRKFHRFLTENLQDVDAMMIQFNSLNGGR